VQPTDPSPRLLQFGVFEVDLRQGELRKKGQKIKLQERPFQLLAALLERHGEMVTREELAQKLWAGAMVDVDNGLNIAARKLREALGDDANTPRYVETLPRRGYRFIAPVQALPEEPAEAAPSTPPPPAPLASPPRRKARRWAVAAICAAGLGFLAYAVAVPVRPPGVIRMLRLTTTGRAEAGAMVATDGSRVYFNERNGGRWSLAQVSVEGGTPMSLPLPLPLPTTPGDPTVLAISPNSELLVTIAAGVEEDAPLWIIPTVAGPARRVGNVLAHAAVWSRDGRNIVFAYGMALFRVKSDGAETRKLVDTPGKPYWIRWSPPGRAEVLRFSVLDRRYSVWECSPDGRGLHPVLPASRPGVFIPGGETAIDWTPDGSYYFFREWSGRESTIWALREARNWFHPFRRAPVRIFATPLNFVGLAASPNGKRLFFAGGQELRELVSYDARREQFLPFLSGIPVRWVNFSKDGQWVTYVTIPESTLWRSRADGSERLQIVTSPLVATEPHWSPDGRLIAFCGTELGKDYRVYTVPADGGALEKIGPDGYGSCSPSWSPDGSSLMFGRYRSNGLPGPASIWITDWKTKQATILPGSEDVLRPVWSPDGKYVAAMSKGGTRILLYDFQTRHWTGLVSVETSLGVPFWSRDSQYIFSQRVLGSEEQPIFRLNVSTRAIEQVASSRQIPQSGITGYTLTGLTPDDAPIATVFRNNADIYALEMDIP